MSKFKDIIVNGTLRVLKKIITSALDVDDLNVTNKLNNVPITKYVIDDKLDNEIDNLRDETSSLMNIMNSIIDTKVDKIDGKGLSTEDFTTEYLNIVKESDPHTPISYSNYVALCESGNIDNSINYKVEYPYNMGILYRKGNSAYCPNSIFGYDGSTITTLVGTGNIIPNRTPHSTNISIYNPSPISTTPSIFADNGVDVNMSNYAAWHNSANIEYIYLQNSNFILHNWPITNVEKFILNTNLILMGNCLLDVNGGGSGSNSRIFYISNVVISTNSRFQLIHDYTYIKNYEIRRDYNMPYDNRNLIYNMTNIVGILSTNGYMSGSIIHRLPYKYSSITTPLIMKDVDMFYGCSDELPITQLNINFTSSNYGSVDSTIQISSNYNDFSNHIPLNINIYANHIPINNNNSNYTKATINIDSLYRTNIFAHLNRDNINIDLLKNDITASIIQNSTYVNDLVYRFYNCGGCCIKVPSYTWFSSSIYTYFDLNVCNFNIPIVPYMSASIHLPTDNNHNCNIHIPYFDNLNSTFNTHDFLLYDNDNIIMNGIYLPNMNMTNVCIHLSKNLYGNNRSNSLKISNIPKQLKYDTRIYTGVVQYTNIYNSTLNMTHVISSSWISPSDSVSVDVIDVHDSTIQLLYNGGSHQTITNFNQHVNIRSSNNTNICIIDVRPYQTNEYTDIHINITNSSIDILNIGSWRNNRDTTHIYTTNTQINKLTNIPRSHTYYSYDTICINLSNLNINTLSDTWLFGGRFGKIGNDPINWYNDNSSELIGESNLSIIGINTIPGISLRCSYRLSVLNLYEVREITGIHENYVDNLSKPHSSSMMPLGTLSGRHLEIIGDRAFVRIHNTSRSGSSMYNRIDYNYTSPLNVNLPDVEYIGNYAFDSCHINSGIYDLLSSGKCDYIGKYAFNDCWFINDIDIMTINVNKIDDCAFLNLKFRYNNNLDRIVNHIVINNTAYIGNKAFVINAAAYNKFNSMLTPLSLTIDNTITYIGNSAFNAFKCNKLNDTAYTYVTANCGYLSNLIVNNDFNCNLPIEYFNCNNLILKNIFSNLKDLTTEETKVVTLGNTQLDRCTADDKAIATAKNWTLA